MNLLEFILDSSPMAVLLKALIGALLFCLVGALLVFCCVFSTKTSLKRTEIESQPGDEVQHLEMVETTDFYGHVIEELKWKIGNRKKFIEAERGEKVLKFTTLHPWRATGTVVYV